MKIIVVSNYCQESSEELVQALREEGINAHYLSPQEYEYDPIGPHRLFAYGWSGSSQYSVKGRINTARATSHCIDKSVTLDAFSKAGVPHPEYRINRNRVPEPWDHVVVRDSRTGRKAEGFDIIAQCEGQKLPYGELYTKYFYHRYEYRIVCFMGKVVGIYYKRPVGTHHEFISQPLSNGFDAIIKDAERACKALKIDYVGYDVVVQNKRSYRFLEANSGPVITDEAKNAIVSYYKGLK